MRNNQDRLALPDNPKSNHSPVPQVATENPSGFSFAIPTEVIDLPSKGQLYPSDHPLHNVASLEIRHMTAKDEDILTSENFIKKGIVFDRLLESIVVDKRIKARHLLIGDKNAVLMACRMHGYGAIYETKLDCPKCDEENTYEFDLATWKIKDILFEEAGVVKTENNTFLVVLPQTGVEVEFRFLTGEDEKKITSLEERNKKMNLPSSSSTNLLKSFIVSINGFADGSSIYNFVENVPASDARFLRKAYNQTCPDLDTTHNFVCAHCDYEGSLEVPLNVDFFWPQQ